MADRVVVEQGINWIMSFVVGIVAIGFGIYLFFDPGNATTLIAAIIAFALLLGSLIHLLQGFRRNANEFAARAALLSGGVGVTTGAIVCLDLFYDYLSSPAARIILASGLIVYGILGIVGAAVQRVRGTVVRTVVTCAFALAFAALLIWNSQADQLNTNWFAAALVVTGLLLLGLGFFARSHQDRLLQQRTPSAASPAPGRRMGLAGLRGGTAPVQAGATSSGRRGVGQSAGHDPVVANVPTPAGPEPTPAPVIGPPAGTTASPAPGSTATVERPAGQPGQDTRNRLLDDDGRPGTTGAGTRR